MKFKTIQENNIFLVAAVTGWLFSELKNGHKGVLIAIIFLIIHMIIDLIYRHRRRMGKKE